MNPSNKNDDLFLENNIIDLKEILRKYLEYKFWFVGSVLIALYKCLYCQIKIIGT